MWNAWKGSEGGCERRSTITSPPTRLEHTRTPAHAPVKDVRCTSLSDPIKIKAAVKISRCEGRQETNWGKKAASTSCSVCQQQKHNVCQTLFLEERLELKPPSLGDADSFLFVYTCRLLQVCLLCFQSTTGRCSRWRTGLPASSCVSTEKASGDTSWTAKRCPGNHDDLYLTQTLAVSQQ